jgi:(p)ppGpp synthase/HD superfamily hydrolase
MWNVHSRVKDGLSRSTNYCESWHNAFTSTLAKHPLFYALVDALRKEQKKTESEILKLQTGIVHKRKTKYVLLDERIQNVLSRYSIEKFEDFYENLSLILKY